MILVFLASPHQFNSGRISTALESQSTIALVPSANVVCSLLYLLSTHLQSQRDCVLQPRVARHELPWVRIRKTPSTPTGLRRCSPRPNPARLKRHNSFGVEVPTRTVTQGSSFLATLGFEAESLWDSPLADPAKDACKVQRGQPTLQNLRPLDALAKNAPASWSAAYSCPRVIHRSEESRQGFSPRSFCE